MKRIRDEAEEDNNDDDKDEVFEFKYADNPKSTRIYFSTKPRSSLTIDITTLIPEDQLSSITALSVCEERNFPPHPRINVSELSINLGVLENLTKFRLSMDDVQFNIEILTQCQKLESISLNDMGVFTGLIGKLSRLEHLTFLEAGNSLPPSARKDSIVALTQLKSLRLSDVNISDYIEDDPIVTMPMLEELDISGLYSIELPLNPQQHFPNLHCLTVHQDNPILIEKLSGLVTLVKLDLSHCKTHTIDISLTQLTRLEILSLPRLESPAPPPAPLNLFGIGLFKRGERAVFEIPIELARITTLKHLELNGNSLPTSPGLNETWITHEEICERQKYAWPTSKECHCTRSSIKNIGRLYVNKYGYSADFFSVMPKYVQDKIVRCWVIWNRDIGLPKELLEYILHNVRWFRSR